MRDRGRGRLSLPPSLSSWPRESNQTSLKVLHITRTLPQEMLGPMVLSRVVKDAGHDMRAICLPDPRWLSKIREHDPDVVT